MYSLSAFASLILLCDSEKNIDEIKIQFGFYGPYGEGGLKTFVTNWGAGVVLLPPQNHFSILTPSLQTACDNILTTLKNKNFIVESINPCDIITECNSVEVILQKLETLLVDSKRDWTLSVRYIPGLKAKNLGWGARVISSDWGQGLVAQTYDNDLYKVCQDIWAKLQEEVKSLD